VEEQQYRLNSLGGFHSPTRCFGKREKSFDLAGIRTPNPPARSLITILTKKSRLVNVLGINLKTEPKAVFLHSTVNSNVIISHLPSKRSVCVFRAASRFCTRWPYAT